jgi:hypothetical protein
MKPNFEKHVLAAVLKNVPEFNPSNVKESHWLIDCFLAEGSIQLIYGTYGTFKSTLLLKAAWAVSRGEDFLGMKSRKRVVLYFDYENPPSVIKGRCHDLGVRLPCPMFRIWDRFHGEEPLVPGKEDLEKLVKQIKKQTGRYPWLIFDSWTSLLKSGEGGENTGQVAPIFQAIRRLCDLGATCTIIDHTTKYSKKIVYGAGAKMTQMDTTHNFIVKDRSGPLLDFRSSETVVRVESFLKRYVPDGVGTFSFKVKAKKDSQEKWHIRSLKSTEDEAVSKLGHQIKHLKHLIKRHPTLGQEELANLAAKKKKRKKQIIGRDPARQLLQEGTGKHWKVIAKGSQKLTYQVLKSRKP